MRCVMVSIHAPARGATNNAVLDGIRTVGFNSRAREGRDADEYVAAFGEPVSIHAPARGATQRGGYTPRIQCFNSRAREGRDQKKTII